VNNCPICQCPMCEYVSENWQVRICWACGHYESDSPAYREHPKLFENLVRDDPLHFIAEFLKRGTSDEFSQKKRSDKDYTEPRSKVYIGG